jgi:glycosyltransferase involved in cell wall biosynthesis
MDTIVVIPCYNEAARLQRDAFATYATANADIGFLFVDDGSSDDTKAVLMTMCAALPDTLDYVSLSANDGKAEAVRRGVLAALERGPRFVGYWDADLSTPLGEIARFRDALEADPRLFAVLGSRVRRLGATIERRAWRHYLGRLFATAVALVVGVGVYDSQCGAKLFRAGDEIAGVFSRPFISRWAFDVELISRLLTGLRPAGSSRPETTILELPLTEWRHVPGSKLGPSQMIQTVLDLVRIRAAHRDENR